MWVGLRIWEDTVFPYLELHTILTNSAIVQFLLRMGK
jgi:hypothetical protein